MFIICIQGLTHTFFWHILIRLMCFYLHILQPTILSFYFRPWLPNMFTHFFLGAYLPINIFIYWISSVEALLKSQDMLHCYHHIEDTQKTVKQNGAITSIDCQFYLPIFITWSLFKSKVLVLRTWVGDPQLWVQNAKITFRSCKKDEYFFPLVVFC
jgi:hypothetical protein